MTRAAKLIRKRDTENARMDAARAAGMSWWEAFETGHYELMERERVLFAAAERRYLRRRLAPRGGVR